MNPDDIFPRSDSYNTLNDIKKKIFTPTDTNHLTQPQSNAIQDLVFLIELVRTRWSMANSSHVTLLSEIVDGDHNPSMILAWRIAISVQSGADVVGALAPGPVTLLGIPGVVKYLLNFPGRAHDFIQAESASHMPGPAGCVIEDTFITFLRQLVSTHIVSPLLVITPSKFTIMHVLVAADDCNGVQMCQILVMTPQPLLQQERAAPRQIGWDDDPQPRHSKNPASKKKDTPQRSFHQTSRPAQKQPTFDSDEDFTPRDQQPLSSDEDD